MCIDTEGHTCEFSSVNINHPKDTKDWTDTQEAAQFTVHQYSSPLQLSILMIHTACIYSVQQS